MQAPSRRVWCAVRCGQATEGSDMGFMDKAKQMADQAQQKLEEAQKQFNDGQAQRGQESGQNVRYDKHGRPIADSVPPAAQTPAAPVSPADQQAEAAAGAPEAPAAPAAPAQEQPAEKAPVKDGVNATPDPFKPLQ